MTDPAVNEACAFLQGRSAVGLEKYGRTVRESPDDMLTHAREEAADLLVYLTELERRQWSKKYDACWELDSKERVLNERDELASENARLTRELLDMQEAHHMLANDLDTARESLRKMHRRAQLAEAACGDWREARALSREQCTGRFFPALAALALAQAEEEIARLTAALHGSLEGEE